MNIEKNKVGRPRKWDTEEARNESTLKKRRDSYISVKRATPNRADNPSYSMFVNAKKRAKDQNVPFMLSLEDIKIPLECPLLGIPLIRGIGKYTDNSPTLDKIIPLLGYVKGNVQVVSMRANRIKDNSSFQEFEKIYMAWKSQREVM